MVLKTHTNASRQFYFFICNSGFFLVLSLDSLQSAEFEKIELNLYHMERLLTIYSQVSEPVSCSLIFTDLIFQLLQYKKKCTDYETKIHSQSISQVIREY